MHFAHPYWLLLILLVPALVTLAVVVARLRGKQWAPFLASRLRQRLLLRGSPVPRWLAFSLALAALTCLVISLARPQSEAGTRTESILGRNILIALDLSRSMKTPDLKPDRLTQAKAMCYELLDALPNDRIGLVGFAGTPYLFAPLTVDHAAVRETVSELEIDWIPTGGSNLAGGLELAIETLKKTGTRQNALILMTDGEEHVGRIGDLAAAADAAGIQVITIGFGTAAGDFVPDSSSNDGYFRNLQGERVISKLEPGPLKRVATVTGGRFAIATSGSDIPAMVQSAVSDLDQVALEGRRTTVVADYFQWTLLPAILALMGAVFAGTRWRGVAKAGVLTAACSLFLVPQRAEAVSYSEARHALESGRFSESAQAFGTLAEEAPDAGRSFSYRLAQGTAAYRAQDWATARHAFSEALRAPDASVRSAAHHGLANTLFEIGWARLSGGPRYPGLPEESEEDGEAKPPTGFERLSDAILDPPDADDVGDMIGFEKMVKQRLAEWMAEPTEPDAESNGSRQFNELLSDWIDAVKHYGTSDLDEAAHNRELTLVHLRKIQEILKQVEENAQQIQALPMPGQGEPQEGEGQGDGSEGEGQGGKGQGSGHGGEDREDEGDGGEEESEDEQGPGEGEREESTGEKDDKDDTEPRPGETPEEAAERLLRENADLQKGALSPGRRRFSRPEKDW